MIRIRDLQKIGRMGDVEVRGLDGIDLEIRKGEFLGIMDLSPFNLDRLHILQEFSTSFTG